MFYRNRVIGNSDAATTGFVLEPCRGDNLNMWLECSFENSSAGIEMTGNDVPIVASSVFANCGRSVACGGNKALLNSVVRAGRQTSNISDIRYRIR